MSVNRIIENIKQYDTIIIHRHVRPDADAYGSQAGLKEMIKHSFPEKSVYAVGEVDPSLTFLAKMDQISEHDYHGALVIVCDTANTGRISDERYTLGDKLIKIDHHPNHDAYGDLLWVDTNASSTSEMIYELYLNGKNEGFKLHTEAARLIYSGIVGDTGRFLFPSTTNKTFHYAADLVTYNFDRVELYNGLYRVSNNIARLRGYILQNYHITDFGMSTIKLTKDILEQFNVEPIESGNLVSVLGDIDGIQAWAIFVEEEELIRVRLRSKGPIVNKVAEKFNGGGHPLAAGASVSTWEEANSLIKELEKTCLAFQK